MVSMVTLEKQCMVMENPPFPCLMAPEAIQYMLFGTVDT